MPTDEFSTEGSMRNPTNTGESAPEDTYDRYREWLPFTPRVDNFSERRPETRDTTRTD